MSKRTPAEAEKRVIICPTVHQTTKTRVYSFLYTAYVDAHVYFDLLEILEYNMYNPLFLYSQHFPLYI